MARGGHRLNASPRTPLSMCNAAVGPHEWTVVDHETSCRHCSLRIESCRMLEHAELDAVRYAELLKSAPAATTMQFESEPAGAEARTSLGQACRTPCTLAVTASEFTVSFSLPGYQPQTVPVRVVASADGRSGGPAPRAEPGFRRIAAGGRRPPVARKPAPAKKKPRPAPRPAPTAMAPEQPAVARPRARLALAAGALRQAQSRRNPRCGRPTGGRFVCASLTWLAPAP